MTPGPAGTDVAAALRAEAAGVAAGLRAGGASVAPVPSRRPRSIAFHATWPDDPAGLVLKRASATAAAFEARLCREILPDLGVAAPRLVALVPAQDAGAAWLVTAYVAGVPLAPAQPGAVRALAAWAAGLHAASADADRPAGLPDRDATWICARIAAAAEACALGAGNPALTRGERGDVTALGTILAETAADRPAVEALAAAMPGVLVHADLSPGNVRVAPDGRITVLDWETAGWGTALLDLPLVDADAYGAALDGRLGMPAPALLRRMRALGTIAWVGWVLPGEGATLTSPWPHRSARKIAAYLERIRARAGADGGGWRG